MEQLSMTELFEARDAAMKQALDHANAVIPEWGERAYAMLRSYIAESGGASFIAPEVRAWAMERGLPAPTTNYAWGGVFARAARARLIRRIGYEQYGDRTMHLQSVSRWSAP